MNILVSACLLGVECRYNGFRIQVIGESRVEEFLVEITTTDKEAQ